MTMPVRRCIRKKRKLIEKDEQYAVFKRAAHAVPDDAPSSEPEGLPEDNAPRRRRQTLMLMMG